MPLNQIEVKLRLQVLTLAVIMFFAAGCGYHFTGESSGLLAGKEWLKIEYPTNFSRQPGLEGPINEALKRKFLKEGYVEPISSDDAEAVLQSRILSYRESPFSYREDRITQYRAEVGLEAKLIIDGEVRLRRTFERHWIFTTSDVDLLELENNRRQVFQKIAADLADAIYVQITESF